MPICYNRKDGKPSAYNFACGAVYRKEFGTARIWIYKEHGVYHVRGNQEAARLFWDSFETNKEAWAAFSKRCREYRQKAKVQKNG